MDLQTETLPWDPAGWKTHTVRNIKVEILEVSNQVKRASSEKWIWPLMVKKEVYLSTLNKIWTWYLSTTNKPYLYLFNSVKNLKIIWNI
jgi:hypothetical protein